MPGEWANEPPGHSHSQILSVTSFSPRISECETGYAHGLRTLCENLCSLCRNYKEKRTSIFQISSSRSEHRGKRAHLVNRRRSISKLLVIEIHPSIEICLIANDHRCPNAASWGSGSHRRPFMVTHLLARLSSSDFLKQAERVRSFPIIRLPLCTVSYVPYAVSLGEQCVQYAIRPKRREEVDSAIEDKSFLGYSWPFGF